MKTTSLLLIFSLSALLIGCGKGDKSTATVNETKDTACSGSYMFTVTDTCVRPLDADFPSDTLSRNQYLPDSSGRSYCVRFSAQKDTVFIKADSVIGVMDTATADKRIYVLTHLFAGGCFVVWFNLEPMRAEYTEYGSGLPIVWSERGTLVWRE